MKFIQKNKLYILEIIFLILLSLTPLLWFKPGHIVIGVDSGYPVDYEKYFEQRVFTWLGSQNFGIDMSAEVGVMPYSGLTAVISMLGFSQYDVQKVLFVFWFLLITFSIYVFLSYLSPKKEYWIVRISGTIIYSFSLHLYSFWLQGEQPILASYVILPFFSLFILRFAQGLSVPLKTAIYLNIVYFLFSSGGVRGIPLIGPIIVTSIVITIYYFFVNFKKEGFSYIKRFLILSVFSLIFLFLCNAYFFYPFISSFLLQYNNQVAIAGGITGAIDWARFISTHTNFTNLFRLHGDNSWYSMPHLWANAFLTNPILIIISFVFPIIAFLSPVISDKKDRRIIILFLFIGIFGLFFSAGAHLPLGYIYIFMMEHIPGFAAFRSGYYKFMPIVYFSFAVLVGFGLYYIGNKFSNLKGKLIGIVAIMILLLYHYPYFTGANFDFNSPFSTMVKVPSYVTNFAKMQAKTPDRFRTLVVPPPADAFNIKTYSWGYWNSYPLFPLITDRGFVVNDAFVYNENENRFINLIYLSLRKNDLNTFINSVNNTNIKYILLTKDIVKDYVMSSSEDPLKYSHILEDKKNFKLIWQEGEWQLYEIILANPQKIKAHSFVINKVSENMPIDNLLYTNSFPFMHNNDLVKNKNLPVKSELIDHPCLSCVMLDAQPGPAITAQNITPSSIFYKYKIEREKKILNTNDSIQQIDGLLGLSAKRVSELDVLNYSSPDSEEKLSFASDLLYSYWKKLNYLYNKEYKESLNYALLKRIAQYLVFEKNVINNIVNIRGYDKNNLIGKSLINTSKEMDGINTHLQNKLNAHDWKSNFIYDISNASDKVYINKTSLPRDLFNNPIYPISYQIDGKFNNFYIGQEYISLPNGKKTLMLTFNLVNLFSNPEKIALDYNNETKNCLVSEVKNYSGVNKYIINVDVKDIDRGVMHIKREYQVFKTEDYISPSVNLNTFNPDLSAETYTERTGRYTYNLISRPNDISAKIYFCSHRLQDPEDVFKNITVTQEVSPLVFSVFNHKVLNGVVPKITFNKINSTYYKITVENARSPYILTFSERYSPIWEAKIGSYVLKDQFMINGYANGWYIDKKGNYNIDLIFSTQGKFEQGLIVTTIMMLALLGYIALNIIKKYK